MLSMESISVNRTELGIGNYNIEADMTRMERQQSAIIGETKP